MEKMDLIVAETRRQLETMEESIEEPRSGGDGVREEMQTVSDSTADIVQENMKDKARGELQKPTQRGTFKEIVDDMRDKKETLPWRRKCYYCKGEHRAIECPQRPTRKWECYFCEGEHKSTECPQYLILLARIQKWENEEEWEDSKSDSDSDLEEEEEEEIGPTQVSKEDRGSEPYLDITEKEDGPTTKGVVPKETEVEGGPVTEEFFPNEIQIILVEDQDSLYDELPPKEMEPKMEPTSGVEALNRGSYRMASLELEELQKRRKDRCRELSSDTPVLVHEESHHPGLEDFVKEKSLPKNANNMEHVKSRLEVKNFHEEKT